MGNCISSSTPNFNPDDVVIEPDNEREENIKATAKKLHKKIKKAVEDGKFPDPADHNLSLEEWTKLLYGEDTKREDLTPDKTDKLVAMYLAFQKCKSRARRQRNNNKQMKQGKQRGQSHIKGQDKKTSKTKHKIKKSGSGNSQQNSHQQKHLPASDRNSPPSAYEDHQKIQAYEPKADEISLESIEFNDRDFNDSKALIAEVENGQAWVEYFDALCQVYGKGPEFDRNLFVPDAEGENYYLPGELTLEQQEAQRLAEEEQRRVEEERRLAATIPEAPMMSASFNIKKTSSNSSATNKSSSNKLAIATASSGRSDMINSTDLAAAMARLTPVKPRSNSKVMRQASEGADFSSHQDELRKMINEIGSESEQDSDDDYWSEISIPMY